MDDPFLAMQTLFERDGVCPRDLEKGRHMYDRGVLLGPAAMELVGWGESVAVQTIPIEFERTNNAQLFLDSCQRKCRQMIQDCVGDAIEGAFFQQGFRREIDQFIRDKKKEGKLK